MDAQILGDTAWAVLDSRFWAISQLFIITYIIGALVKGVASSLYEFIIIKTDILGSGSLVEYQGKRSTIQDIGLRRILLKREGGELLYIRTKDWHKMTLIIRDSNNTEERP
jgi:hypothetical protein